jgi:hypothetical protein
MQTAAALERMGRRKWRAVHAEVKTLKDRVELMRKHKVSTADLRRAEESLRKAQTELYMVS